MKKILVVSVVALTVLFLARDVVARVVLETGIRMVTGLNVTIVETRLARSALAVRGLTLHNPAGFPDRVMMVLPELYVDYDPAGFLKGKVHLEEVRLDLKEFTVVRNQKGELNLDSLKGIKEGKKGAKRKEVKKGSPLQIDVLQLKIGKVVFKDYSRPTPPSVHNFTINLNERHANIQRPEVLVSLIVVKALTNTTFASLTNFDLKQLRGGVKKLLPFENP